MPRRCACILEERFDERPDHYLWRSGWEFELITTVLTARGRRTPLLEPQTLITDAPHLRDQGQLLGSREELERCAEKWFSVLLGACCRQPWSRRRLRAMRLRDERQLAETLQRGLPRAVLLTSDEPLLVQEAADKVREAALAAGVDERVPFYVDSPSFDFRELLDSSASLSLFASRAS